MFKLYIYNITVFNSQFLSCWQSMAYGWSPTQPARVIHTYMYCAILLQFCVYYRDCRNGAIFKLYLHNITV